MAQDSTLNSWKKARDALGVLRELIIVIVFLVLVLGLSFWPEFLKDRLLRAGFKSGDIAGMHWEPELREANQQTNEARQQMTVLEKRLSDFQKDLRGIAARVKDPALGQEIRVLSQGVEQSIGAATSILADLDASAQAQESVLQLAKPTEDSDTGAWIIIVSADKELDQAQHEVERARGLGYTASIFNRKGWLRTAIRFPDRAAAEEALPKIREKLQKSAYVAKLNTWCPSRENRDGVWVCLE